MYSLSSSSHHLAKSTCGAGAGAAVGRHSLRLWRRPRRRLLRAADWGRARALMKRLSDFSLVSPSHHCSSFFFSEITTALRRHQAAVGGAGAAALGGWECSAAATPRGRGRAGRRGAPVVLKPRAALLVDLIPERHVLDLVALVAVLDVGRQREEAGGQRDFDVGGAQLLEGDKDLEATGSAESGRFDLGAVAVPHTLKQCWRQGVCRCALLCGACAASEIAPRRAPGAAGRVVADLARALRPDQSRRELWHRVSTGALLMGWRGRKRIYKGKRGQRVCSSVFFLSFLKGSVALRAT